MGLIKETKTPAQTHEELVQRLKRRGGKTSQKKNRAKKEGVLSCYKTDTATVDNIARLAGSLRANPSDYYVYKQNDGKSMEYAACKIAEIFSWGLSSLSSTLKKISKE